MLRYMQFINVLSGKIILTLYQNKKIDIILPWRIGDAILNIPMLVALKQLNEKYNDNNKIRIVTQPFLTKLYAPLEIFECKSLTVGRRLISHLKPADVVFFYPLSAGMRKFISQIEKTNRKKPVGFIFSHNI